MSWKSPFRQLFQIWKKKKKLWKDGILELLLLPFCSVSNLFWNKPLCRLIKILRWWLKKKKCNLIAETIIPFQLSHKWHFIFVISGSFFSLAYPQKYLRWITDIYMPLETFIKIQKLEKEKYQSQIFIWNQKEESRNAQCKAHGIQGDLGYS